MSLLCVFLEQRIGYRVHRQVPIVKAYESGVAFEFESPFRDRQKIVEINYPKSTSYESQVMLEVINVAVVFAARPAVDKIMVHEDQDLRIRSFRDILVRELLIAHGHGLMRQNLRIFLPVRMALLFLTWQ